ncbi:heme-degrading domain-containing protein [Microbacterium oryzae]|uniref:Heme-degrading domain-containing protein n=1 Tax=Microbacterium oryzae TaxID=743009 RepID=A0A6I6E7D9_9MICO|nr:heme-degrading domain-containing protein [Microbacterium oryzae]QGU27158.1 heme-degrading domain-containing protein [Microbacterium oryzae]
MFATGESYRKLDGEALAQRIAEEEAELDFDSFGVDDAWAVGSWLRDAARERGYGVGFAVVLGEHRAFHAATDGAAAVNDAWLERKFRTVRHFGHASLAVKAQYERGGGSFAADSALDPTVYAAAGGAFPIRVRGSLVGAAGVSGLEMHDDHALVVEALRAHRERRG